MAHTTFTEAEYTFQLRKEIVPIMMQRKYTADGWLGMLLGSKLYINFGGKFSFEHAYSLLLKELKDRGRIGAGKFYRFFQTVVREKNC